MRKHTVITIAIAAGMLLGVSAGMAEKKAPPVPKKEPPWVKTMPSAGDFSVFTQVKITAVAKPDNTVMVTGRFERLGPNAGGTETLSCPRLTINRGQTGTMSICHTDKASKLETGLRLTVVTPQKGDSVSILAVQMDKGKVIWAHARDVPIKPDKKPKT
jgi:hypothetical protein